MGSLTSSPKIPQQPTVIVKDTSQTSDADDARVSGVQSEALASEERRKNLLARDRSRAGTIVTSFLGVSDNAGQRKTLLGE